VAIWLRGRKNFNADLNADLNADISFSVQAYISIS
jgi:hypothetical protein